MSPLLIVAFAGLSALIGLAVVVGVLEGRSQRAAWVRIAEGRRALRVLQDSIADERAELVAWESALGEESERRRNM